MTFSQFVEDNVILQLRLNIKIIKIRVTQRVFFHIECKCSKWPLAVNFHCYIISIVRTSFSLDCHNKMCKEEFSCNLHLVRKKKRTVYLYLKTVKARWTEADSGRWSKSEQVKERQWKREERERVRQRVFKHPWHLSLGLVPTLVSYWFNWAMATPPHWSKQKTFWHLTL